MEKAEEHLKPQWVNREKNCFVFRFECKMECFEENQSKHIDFYKIIQKSKMTHCSCVTAIFVECVCALKIGEQSTLSRLHHLCDKKYRDVVTMRTETIYHDKYLLEIVSYCSYFTHHNIR